MSMAEDYRDYFIRNLHDALSGHTSNSIEEAVRYVIISSDTHTSTVRRYITTESTDYS